MFLVSLATLTLELLLTRLWGVLSLYHFAFVAVSMAMFGLTVGAVLVYLYPNYFSEQKTKSQLTTSALLFAIGVVFSCLTQLSVPFTNHRSFLAFYLAFLIYCVAALPFCLSGICITLAFTRYWKQIGRLYAADLLGAALGCLLLAAGLTFTDGPSMIFVTAALAAFGAYFFARESASASMVKWSIALGLIFATVSGVNAITTHQQKPLITFLWSKSAREAEHIYEKWNAFSRITVTGDPNELSDAYGWGTSSIIPKLPKVRQLQICMDSLAQTAITGFSGNCEGVRFLKYDLSNFVYNLKSAPNVLVVGVGGGRDVLSALCAGAKSIIGVDINPDMISTLNGRFGDFSGHLDRQPGIKFVVEDARTFISRQKSAFDVVQISVIDTQVVSSSGALSLTENSLYTVEAWQEFIASLAPDGMVSCTRWFCIGYPGEVERLVATARAALLKAGVKDPRANMVVVRNVPPPGHPDLKIAATLLVKREPFTSVELDRIKDEAAQLKFAIALSPHQADDKVMQAVATGTADGGRAVGTLVNLEPVTDNSPFFFYMMRPMELIWHRDVMPTTGDIYVKAEHILVELLFVVAFLSLLCVLLPLWKSGDRRGLTTAGPFLLYFAAIGLGFILFEISQMQRLIIFLGHPTYSITVVLFTLLLSSSLGSYLTRNVTERSMLKTAMGCLIGLLLVMLAYWFLTPMLLQQIKLLDVASKCLGTAAMLFPVGLLLGTAFPLGLKLAAPNFKQFLPWFWGINGVASTCGSVVAVIVAIGSGLSTAFAISVACYLMALLSLLLSTKMAANSTQASD